MLCSVFWWWCTKQSSFCIARVERKTDIPLLFEEEKVLVKRAASGTEGKRFGFFKFFWNIRQKKSTSGWAAVTLIIAANESHALLTPSIYYHLGFCVMHKLLHTPLSDTHITLCVVCVSEILLYFLHWGALSLKSLAKHDQSCITKKTYYIAGFTRCIKYWPFAAIEMLLCAIAIILFFV